MKKTKPKPKLAIQRDSAKSGKQSKNPLPLSPSQKRASRIRLDSIRALRCEAGKLYCEMRVGRVDAATGCKLGFILQLLGKLVETETFESRLTALEREADELD